MFERVTVCSLSRIFNNKSGARLWEEATGRRLSLPRLRSTRIAFCTRIHSTNIQATARIYRRKACRHKRPVEYYSPFTPDPPHSTVSSSLPAALVSLPHAYKTHQRIIEFKVHVLFFWIFEIFHSLDGISFVWQAKTFCWLFFFVIWNLLAFFVCFFCWKTVKNYDFQRRQWWLLYWLYSSR
jgi:hypothetical protein